jgi:hypothetical protein
VKDICVALAKGGAINDTWKVDGKRKPHDHHRIELASSEAESKVAMKAGRRD